MFIMLLQSTPANINSQNHEKKFILAEVHISLNSKIIAILMSTIGINLKPSPLN